MYDLIKQFKVFFFVLAMTGICNAQFYDSFQKERIEGWFFFTGDGNATMDFVQKDNYSHIIVDATKDQHNVWWAIIKRDITNYIDLSKLKDPNYELRVEAKVRVGSAPRRINFMINTQRTVNFHEHLMEYDIPDTSNWHIISMTTKNFDAVPGDTVYVQLSVTDWGLGKYYVDLDYYRADVVDINITGPEKGEPLPYHPPIPELNSFSNQLNVTDDALINTEFPDVNFYNWYNLNNSYTNRVLTISGNQWAILKWDLTKFKGRKISGSGLLEITTHSVFKGGNYIKTYGKDLGEEFDKVRIIEIFDGDSNWDQKDVTYNSFMLNKKYTEVFNSQMIFDVELSNVDGDKNYITLSRPVMQRLFNGITKGLLIRPLGSLTASFYSSKDKRQDNAPKLFFNLEE